MMALAGVELETLARRADHSTTSKLKQEQSSSTFPARAKVGKSN